MKIILMVVVQIVKKSVKLCVKMEKSAKIKLQKVEEYIAINTKEETLFY